MNGMTQNALAAYERLIDSWGNPLSVVSGYRSPEHNAKVGGAKNSQHIHGNAYDVDVSSLTPAQRQALARQARASGFQGIGVYNNSMHFDVGPRRAWGPSYSRDSLPKEYAWLLDMGEDVAPTATPQHEEHQHEQEAPKMEPLRFAFNGLDPASFMMPTNQLGYS